MAVHNVYDVLATPPALEAEDMVVALEGLARQLVSSGRMRVDAGDKRNFVRYLDPFEHLSQSFSLRELNDPSLVPVTLRILQDVLAAKFPPEALEREAQKALERLHGETRKLLPVPEETELKLARLFVQSAHPSVIMLILWEEVEVFINYGHTVGDMMDIENWQKMGASSGLQSTSGRRNYCIYVSCGGNPFLSGEFLYSPHDGPAAMARLMVIAGQEIGHFADIRRDMMGRPVARFSADLGCSAPTEQARVARLRDMENVKKAAAALRAHDLDSAAALERSVAFYTKHRPKDLITRTTKAKSKRANKRFFHRAEKAGLKFLKHFPGHDSPATHLVKMLEDMAFNLAPMADAYRHPNPKVEEAIACAEALARVPQQVVKWGHHTTIALYPNLYQLYYGEVIPAAVKTYEALSGKKYQFSYQKRKLRWQDKMMKRWAGLTQRFSKTKA